MANLFDWAALRTEAVPGFTRPPRRRHNVHLWDLYAALYDEYGSADATHRADSTCLAGRRTRPPPHPVEFFEGLLRLLSLPMSLPIGAMQ